MPEVKDEDRKWVEEDVRRMRGVFGDSVTFSDIWDLAWRNWLTMKEKARAGEVPTRACPTDKER